MTAVMDTAALSRQPHSHSIIQQVIACTEELKEKFIEARVPVTDDSQTLQRFCAKLEYLLRDGLKQRTGLIRGNKKDYWDYFCNCLAANKGLNEGVKFVKSIGEYKTSVGKGRALIRFSLVHQRLADTVQQCVSDGKATSQWYNPTSIWMKHANRAAIINALYDLNDVNFDLGSSGYDLDNAWPSFAKKTAPVGAQYWQAPSRSSSFSSLVSIPLQDPFVSARERSDTSTSSFKDVEIDLLHQDLTQADTMRAELVARITELEQECEDLSIQRENLLDSQSRHDVLQETYQSDKQKWKQSELDLQAQITSLEKRVQSLSSKSADLEQTVLDKRELYELMDESYKAQVQKAENDLQDVSGKLTTALSEKQDEQKSRELNETLLASTELKLANLEQKNIELLNKIEFLVGEKDDNVQNQLSQVHSFNDAVVQLKTAEHNGMQMKARCVELEKQLSTYESDLKTYNQEIKHLQTVLSDTEDNLKELQRISAEKDASLKTLQGVLSETEGSVLKLTDEKKHITSDYMKQLADKKDEVNLVKQLLETLQKSFTETSAENLHLQSKLVLKEDGIRLLTADKDKISADFMRQLSEVEAKSRAEHDIVTQQVISESSDKILTLESEIKQLNQHLNDKSEMMSSLQIIVDAAEANILDSVEEKSMLISDYNEQLAAKDKKCKEEIELLKLECVSSSDKLGNLESEVTPLRESLSTMSVENAKLQNGVGKREARIVDLVTEQDSMKTDFTQQLSGIEEQTKTKSDSLQQEIVNNKDKISALELEITSLNETVSEKVEQNLHLQNILESKEASIVKLFSEKESICAVNTMQLAEMEISSKQKVESLERISGGKVTDIESLKLQILSLTEKLADKSDTNSQLQNMVAELEVNNQELETGKVKALTDLKTTLSEMEAESRKERDTMLHTEHELRNQISDLKMEISGLKDSIKEQTEQNSQLENQLCVEKEASNTLNEAIQQREHDLLEQLQASQLLNNEIKEQIKMVKQELETRDEEFDNEQTEHSLKLNQMANEKHELKVANDDLVAKVATLSEEIVIVNDHLCDLEVGLQEKTDDYIEAVQRHGQEIAAWNLLIDWIYTSSTQSASGDINIDDLTPSLSNTDVTEKAKEIANSFSTIRHSSEAAEAKCVKVDSTVQILEAENVDLERELQIAQLELADLKTRLSHLVSEEADRTRKLTGEIAELAAKLDEVTSQVVDKNDQIRNLEKENADDVKLESEACAVMNDVEKLESEISKVNEELVQTLHERDRRNAEIGTLKSELCEKGFVIEHLEQATCDKDSEIKSLMLDLCNKTEAMQRYESDGVEVQKQTPVKAGIDAEIVSQFHNFEQEISLKNTEIQQLDGIIHDNKLSIENLEIAIHEKNSEIVEINVEIEKFKKELCGKDRELDETNQQLLESQRCGDTLCTEVDNKAHITEELQQNNTALQDKVKLLELELAEKTNQMQNLAAEKSVYIDEVSSVNLKVACLEASTNAIKAEFDACREELERQKVECSKLYGDLDTEKVELQSLLDAGMISDEMLDKTRSDLLCKCKELSRMTEQYEYSNKDKQREIEELTSRNDLLKAEISIVKSIFQTESGESLLENVTGEVVNDDLKTRRWPGDERDGKMDILTDEKVKLEVRCSELESQVKDLEAALKHVTELRESTAGSGDADEEISALKESLLRAEAKLKMEQQGADGETDILQQQISALKFQLSAEQMKNQQTQQTSVSHESDLNSVMLRLSEQENIVDQLRAELQVTSSDHNDQLNRHAMQASELMMRLKISEADYEQMKARCDQTCLLLEEERRMMGNVQSLHETECRKYEDILMVKEDEINSLKTDMQQLKRKLIKLIKEKDALWQKTDLLVYEQKIQSSEKWIDDSIVKQCLECKLEFTFTVRKHHCRLCGRIFCWNCSNHWILTAHSSKKSRACNSCFIKQSQSQQDNSSLAGSDSEGDDNDIPTRKSQLWKNRPGLSLSPSHFQQTLNISDSATDESTTSSEIKAHTSQMAYSFQDSALSPDYPNTDSILIASPDQQAKIHSPQETDTALLRQSPQETDTALSRQSPQETDTALSGQVSETLAIAAEADEVLVGDNETDDRKSESIVPTEPCDFSHTTDELTSEVVAESSRDAELQEDDVLQPPHDGFHVISEEEIAHSLSASESNFPVGPENSSFTTSLTISVEELERGHVNCHNDVWIKAGKSFAVPVLIESSGIVLCWQFSTQPKDIGFSATYRHNEITPMADAQVLIPPCKCNSHQQEVKGELTAKKAGVYTLIFDNTYSRLTSKKVSYSLFVRRLP